MNNLIKKMFLLTILLSTTQIISIRTINLSLFQIFLLITSILATLGLIKKGYIIIGNYLIYSFISLFSSFIAFITSTNENWSKSHFLIGVMISTLIFFIPNYFNKKDIVLLEKSLIRSQYITILFSIYSIYIFYFKDGFQQNINLLGDMFYIHLDKEFILRAQASGQIRLSLPYATPPVLSIVMSMCIVILIIDLEIYSQVKRRFLIISFFIILVLTGSRTGIIGLIITFLSGFLKKSFLKFKISKKNFSIIFIMVMTMIILIFFKDRIIYIEKLIKRFSNIDIMSDRHFLVPLDGILIWISSIKNFILGIGFGSSINMVGAHTYLPSHFLNSFVTLIVERGIMGLYLAITLLNMTYNCIKKQDLLNKHESAMAYAIFLGLSSSFFYEGFNGYFLIFSISIGFIIFSNKIKNI